MNTSPRHSAADRRIALIVDNPYRDLPGVVLTGMRLAQPGLTVYLVPMNLQDNEIWALAPDMVVINYLRNTNERYVRQLMDASIRVAVLDTEGGVWPSLDDYATPLATDRATRHGLARFLAWGPKLARHAVEQGWYTADQTVVTGSPRFDLHVPPWREAALRASPYAADIPQPLVLINTNFSIGNPGFKTPEEEVEMWVERLGYPEEKIRRWQAIHQQTLRGFVDLTNRLAERFPGASIVLRPHPFEREATYRALLADRDNVHLIRRGSIDGWALRASVVIQRSCSTAIDAMMAGAPALSTAWLPTALYQQASEAVSIQCESPAELIGCVGQALDGQLAVPAPVRAEFDRVVDEWFYRADGQAHDRAAESLLDALTEDGEPVSRAMCRRGAYRLLDPTYGPARRALLRVKMAARLPADLPVRFWRGSPRVAAWGASAKAFDAAQVQSLIDAFAPTARRVYPDWKAVEAAPAGRTDYQVGYLAGRSVRLARSAHA